VSFYVKISRKRRWCNRFYDISKTNRVRPKILHFNLSLPGTRPD